MSKTNIGVNIEVNNEWKLMQIADKKTGERKLEVGNVQKSRGKDLNLTSQNHQNYS